MRYRRGQRVKAHCQSPKGTPYNRTGKIVYIHPSRRWLNINFGFYVESFMVEDVEPAKLSRRRKKQCE